MTRKPPIHTPEGMKSFLDDKNWKDVDHPKDQKIKVSSLPKVGGARIKKRSRIEEIAHEILEGRGLTGKGRLPDIHKTYDHAASTAMHDSDEARDNGDEDEAERHYDDYHDNVFQRDRARGLMDRIARRKQK